MNTSGQGAGGNVNLATGSLVGDGGGSEFFTGVLALSTGTEGETGDAGTLDVRVGGDIVLRDGALIDSSTFGSGRAGNVAVAARDITVDRAGSGLFTGIGSDTDRRVGGGRAGSVSVQASTLTLLNGGLVSTGTFGSGDGGDVTVTANQIVVRGAGV